MTAPTKPHYGDRLLDIARHIFNMHIANMAIGDQTTAADAAVAYAVLRDVSLRQMLEAADYARAFRGLAHGPSDLAVAAVYLRVQQLNMQAAEGVTV